jgi:hypothetical protein
VRGWFRSLPPGGTGGSEYEWGVGMDVTWSERVWSLAKDANVVPSGVGEARHPDVKDLALALHPQRLSLHENPLIAHHLR